MSRFYGSVCIYRPTTTAGWPQIWKTWNTQGFLWTWKTHGILGNSVQPQGKLT